MALSSLKKAALEKYKFAPVSSWVLGLTTGLLISAVIALDLLIHGISILTFPILVLPMIFSAMFSHLLIYEKGAQLTLRTSFKSFGLYFVRPFNGTFSFFSSLLFSIIVFLTTEMVVSFSASSILIYTNSGFTEAINQFYALLEDVESLVDEYQNVLMMNGGILFNYLCICLFPSLFFAVFVLIYHTSRSSLSLYYRVQTREADGRFAKYVYTYVRRRNGRALFKDYLSLNWPMYLLLTLGFAGGVVLGYFYKHDILFMISFALLGSALAVTFFLPFYFSNQEAIYDKYDSEFDRSAKEVAKYLLTTMQQNIDLSIEEKKRLEKSLDNLSNPLEDKKDEENKKDSNEP